MSVDITIEKGFLVKLEWRYRRLVNTIFQYTWSLVRGFYKSDSNYTIQSTKKMIEAQFKLARIFSVIFRIDTALIIIGDSNAENLTSAKYMSSMGHFGIAVNIAKSGTRGDDWVKFNHRGKSEENKVNSLKIFINKWREDAPAAKAAAPKAKVVKLKSDAKPSSAAKINELRKQREAKLEQSTRTDKLRNMSRDEVLAAAREFNSLRSLHAQVVDGGGIHKKMLDPTPENLVRWMRNPGKFDIRGIDAPRAAEATANLKKPDSFWSRLGF